MPYFGFRAICAVLRGAPLGHIGPTAPSSTRARREATQVEEGAVRHKNGGIPGKRVRKIRAEISVNIREKNPERSKILGKIGPQKLKKAVKETENSGKNSN